MSDFTDLITATLDGENRHEYFNWEPLPPRYFNMRRRVARRRRKILGTPVCLLLGHRWFDPHADRKGRDRLPGDYHHWRCKRCLFWTSGRRSNLVQDHREA